MVALRCQSLAFEAVGGRQDQTRYEISPERSDGPKVEQDAADVRIIRTRSQERVEPWIVLLLVTKGL